MFVQAVVSVYKCFLNQWSPLSLNTFCKYTWMKSIYQSLICSGWSRQDCIRFSKDHKSRIVQPQQSAKNVKKIYKYACSLNTCIYVIKW